MPSKPSKIEPENLVPEEKKKTDEASSSVSAKDSENKESFGAIKEEKTSNGEEGRFSPSTSGKGVLEVMPDGYGFLRANGLSAGPGDIYISQSQIRRFDIRAGDEVEGKVRPPKDTERYFGMLKVEKINGLSTE